MLGTYFVFTLILFILSIVGVVWSYKGDIDTEIKNPLILAMENYKVLSPTLKIISFLFHLSSQRGFFVARNQPEFKKRRRRIYTDEKAKVVAAVWGTEFIQLLAILCVLWKHYI